MSAPHHVMTVSRNGQVSIPATTRARWNTRQVIVVDLGDRIVLRPADGPTALRGRYRDRGPSSDHARQRAHQEEAARDHRR